MAQKPDQSLSAAERKAVKERAAELRASQKKEALEKAVLDKIAEMPQDERAIATKVHQLVLQEAPQLTARTWYGMPAYADAAGKVVVFFQGASKFDARYSTIGFDQAANLDDGSMWPVSFALTELTAADEQKVRALVRKAVS